jgi:hypothetical protein
MVDITDLKSVGLYALASSSLAAGTIFTTFQMYFIAAKEDQFYTTIDIVNQSRTTYLVYRPGCFIPAVF